MDDQHVAPPSIWIRPASMEYSTIQLDYDNDDIEYLAAAPIQAALSACRIHGNSSEVSIRKSDWDALVASVKGYGK